MEVKKLTHMECLDAIMRAPDSGYTPYAKTYARAAYGMVGEELACQIPYILNNLQSWRGEEARTVKARLQEIRRELDKGL